MFFELQQSTFLNEGRNYIIYFFSCVKNTKSEKNSERKKRVIK